MLRRIRLVGLGLPAGATAHTAMLAAFCCVGVGAIV
jgi:hypothetical protein